MIQELDIVAMREQGLSEFRTALTDCVQAGYRPDVPFVQKALLKAMGPIFDALSGGLKIEEHIHIHVLSGVDEAGNRNSYTQAEGLTDIGDHAIELFMDLPPENTA